MSKVEDVARVLCSRYGRDPDGLDWGNGDKPAWRDYEEDARAAIAAMREPTQGMLEAYDDVIRTDFECEPLNLPEAFNAMIDAALTEGGTDG